MYPQQMELSYRRSALAGASSIGLVIALYDTLSGNLRRAAAAVRSQKIEQRCVEVNHALLVLGQLENMVDTNNQEPAANALILFYGYLRTQLLAASVEQSANKFEEQIELVLQVRSAWQQRDMDASRSVPTGLLAGDAASFGERTSFSLSM